MSTENAGRRWEARRWPIGLALVGGALVVIGAKLATIAAFGSELPFWDQWDGEASNLYIPYIQGTLSWSNLVATHNEHRILFTRLLSLLMLDLAGEWQPLFQMAVNAVLHALALGAVLVLITKPLNKTAAISTMVVTALTFAVPIGWENTLEGFQSQFYFLLLFASLSLSVLSRQRAFSLGWIGGILLAVATYFSMASGAITPAIVAGVSLFQIVMGARARSWREVLGVLTMVAATIAMLFFIPSLPYHEPLKAHSVGQFVGALIAVGSFPLGSWLGLILLQAPVLVWAARFLRRRPGFESTGWGLFAFSAWLAGQMASTSFSRAESALSSRYLDLFLLSVPVNLVALLILLQEMRGRVASLLIFIWTLPVIMSLAYDTVRFGLEGVQEKARISGIEEANVRAYLSSGDGASLKAQPFLYIPYPDADRLMMLLSTPEIRAALPEKLRPLDADRNTFLAHTWTKGRAAQAVATIWQWALRLPIIILGLGISFLLIPSLVASLPTVPAPRRTAMD